MCVHNCILFILNVLVSRCPFSVFEYCHFNLMIYGILQETLRLRSLILTNVQKRYTNVTFEAMLDINSLHCYTTDFYEIYAECRKRFRASLLTIRPPALTWRDILEGKCQIGLIVRWRYLNSTCTNPPVRVTCNFRTFKLSNFEILKLQEFSGSSTKFLELAELS